MYEQKQASYFNRARHDILPLLPTQAARCLELGAGTGATLAWLKATGKVQHTTGVELMRRWEAQGQANSDQWITGDAVAVVQQLENDTYDLILCLDVLEHLLDPWGMVDQLSRLLKPGGLLIVSLPNLRTAKVLSNLLWSGRFDYAEQGIMDRTHLRWFTRHSALELLNRAPLQVQKWQASTNAPGSKSAIANALTFGIFADFFTEQFLIQSQKSSNPPK